MRTLGQAMAERTERIRKDHGYRMRLALRDEPDYSNDKQEKPPPQELIIIHRHSDMRKEDWDLLQQTARKLEYLDKKLAEHTEYKRKVPVKSGKTRGIKIE